MTHKGTVQNRCPFFLYFRKKTKLWRRRCSGKRWLVRLKVRAETSTNALFYVIMIICYLIYRKRVWSSWQASLVVTPGTWVRAPGPPPFPILFFQLSFCAGSTLRDTIHPLIQIATRVERPIQGRWLRDQHGIWSNVPHANQRVNEAKGLLGPKMLSIPSTWGQNPPRFASFYIFFYYFFLFISIIVFLINLRFSQ